MDGFDQMGEAMILAQEGQRQLALAAFAKISEGFTWVGKTLRHALNRSTPSVGGA